MTILAKVRGLKSLEVKLKKLPQAAKDEIRKTMGEGAQQIVATMKRLAPKKSGKLAESITYTFGDEALPSYAAFSSKKKRGRGRSIRATHELSVTITAGNSGVRYAHLVEFGTAPHQIKAVYSKALADNGAFFGSEARHPGAAAHPFFYPAYRLHRKSYKSRISRAITRSAKKVAAR